MSEPVVDDPLSFERDKDTGVCWSLVTCEGCGGEGRQMHAHLYPSGHTEVWETCEDCAGEGNVEVYILDPKSPWPEFFKD